MRQFLHWRRRRLSPRWHSVSYRPSLKIQQRTQMLPTRMKWTWWTTHVKTPSTGHHCGLDGWDYQGTEKPWFYSSTSPVFCVFPVKYLLIVISVKCTGAGTLSCKRPTMRAGASVSLVAMKRATASSPSSSKPLCLVHPLTLTGASSELSVWLPSTWRYELLYPSFTLAPHLLTGWGSLQVRWWDSGSERSHNSGNEQLLSHPHAQAAEE